MCVLNAEYVDGLMSENVKLKTLIADLTYHGADRGYTRGSLLWVSTVRASAEACGLTFADIAVLVDAE